MRLKSAIYMVLSMLLAFMVSVAYASEVNSLAMAGRDITWPLIFNGVVPAGLVAWLGRRWVIKLDTIIDELIKSKNDHHTRIGEIETVHRVRGCDSPKG